MSECEEGLFVLGTIPTAATRLVSGWFVRPRLVRPRGSSATASRSKPTRRRWRWCWLIIGVATLACTQLWLLKSATRAVSAPKAPTDAGIEAEQRPIHKDDAKPATFPPGSVVGVDLDATYPAEPQFWSQFRTGANGGQGSANWLAELRKQMPAGVKVPRSLHQTWKDASPPRKLFSPRWSRSLRAQNADWAYKLWTDADNLALIASRYPELLSMYKAYASPIQRADVARYAIAHAHGGVYADLDTECFKPFGPLLLGASLVLSFKEGSNFSRGACNSIFASAAGHPFWSVVFDVLRNRSATPLTTGHTAVLYSTGPAVLREALRRLLRLPTGASISPEALHVLHRELGVVVLDASRLHPVTADRRTKDTVESRPPEAICTHHFVSSWVAHSRTAHANTELRRRNGDATAAVHGQGQPVLRENTWVDGVSQTKRRNGGDGSHLLEARRGGNGERRQKAKGGR